MTEYNTHETPFSLLIKKYDLINNPTTEQYTKDVISLAKLATLEFLLEEISEMAEDDEQLFNINDCVDTIVKHIDNHKKFH